MNTSTKTQLRQFFSDTFGIPIRNIRETYNALGVNNPNDAYKILDNEFKKFKAYITAQENKEKLQQIKKNAKAKAEFQFQQIYDTIKQKEEITKKRKIAREEKGRQAKKQKTSQNLTRKFMIKLTLRTKYENKSKTYEYTTTKLIGPFEEQISKIDEIE